MDNAGFVDVQFGFLSETGIIPDSLAQFGHDCCCFCYSTVDFRFKGDRVGDGGLEVLETRHGLKVAPNNIDV